jgi:CheY-like chemotaxis protein
VSRKRILIIDDDQDARLALHVRLKANDYETHFAADGLSAISEARKIQPDLIILDLGLPAGDGFTVMERLRSNPHLSCIPLIVVSARDPKGNRERAQQCGALAYLQKPVKNEQLLGVVRKLIENEVSSHSVH